MKRRTVFLDQGEFMGGAEHFLLDFLQSLSPTEGRRLNATIFGGQCEEYRARLPESLERKGFNLPGVRGGKIAKVKALIALVLTAHALKKEFKAAKVTQVFTNTPRAHLTALLLKKIWRWDGKWIVMMHDFTTRPAWLVQDIGCFADILIANSMPTRQWLREQLKPKDHEKLRLIENGVQVSTSIVPATELMTLVNLSRIDPQKGQLYFAEAADLLQDRNPDLAFTIIGDSVEEDLSTQEYEIKLKQFAADRKLENLKLEPSVNNPLQTIDQFDGLVFTPTEKETFGRVVIEALSRGKLVIAFAQTGPKEILEHYERWLVKNKKLELPEPNLLLVEPNNAMSLAERMAYFADNPRLVETYTQDAAEFVAQNYSLTETKKRLLEVLLG